MPQYRSIKFFLLLIFLITIIQIISHSQTIPSSARSKKAIEKQKPLLENELIKHGLEFGSPIFIRIFKLTNELEVWIQNDSVFELFKTYEICTYGNNGLGPKLRQGDGMAPEGFYFVRPKQLNPYSSFYLSFNLGYPNRYDRLLNRTGSALMVHGSCVSIGCYAMTDEYIEEIYTLAHLALQNGQPFFRVHIFPFPMTDENMEEHKDSEWIDFWENLKEGYDYFENGKTPPNALVENQSYFFQ